MSEKSISIFWWNERILQNKEKENYGDLLSKYLVEKISGKSVRWVHPKKRSWFNRNRTNYLTVGSIIHHCSTNSIVWGSGIIDTEQKVHNADFRAVRGPETRAYLMKSGYICPEIYGDPAILLPLFFNPKPKKKFKLGIIPHYHDYTMIMDLYGNESEVNVIDLRTMDVEEVTFRILQCENIISSSLHGLIVSHAYGIPAMWMRFSNKLFGDNVKFIDYLKSVRIKIYQGELLDERVSMNELLKMFGNYQVLPSSKVLKELQQGLLASCPFLGKGN